MTRLYSYNNFFAALMRYGVDRGSISKEFPHAWASLIVTALIASVWIAIELRLDRDALAFLPVRNALDESAQRVFDSILILFILFAQLVYYGWHSRWLRLLAQFDDLQESKRHKISRATGAIVYALFAWVLIEIAIAVLRNIEL